MLNFLESTLRQYKGKDLNKINDAIFEAGVLDTNGSDLAVVKTTGLDVSVKAGACIIEVEENAVNTRVIGVLPADETLTCVIGTNYIIYRVDQDVIDNDTININGTNTDFVEAVTTLPADDPYILLAVVQVEGGTTSLTDEMITDSRVMATFKESLRQDIIDIVYANNPLNKLDVYTDGISQENISGADLLSSTEDDGAEGVYSSHSGGGYYFRLNLWQVFEAPEDELGFIYIKKGITREDWNAPVRISVYDVGAGDSIGSTEIDFIEFTANEWQALPEYSIVKLDLNGTYTQGTKYGIKFWTPTTIDTDDSAIAVTSKQKTGIRQLQRNFDDYIGTSPFDEYYEVEDTNLWFRLATKETVDLGTTDNEKIAQVFTAKGKDVRAFTFRKGGEEGVVTGDILFELYKCNDDLEPLTPDAIASKTISETDWSNISIDEEFSVTLSATLSINQKYMVIISPVNVSDTNYRLLWAGVVADTYTEGNMRRYSGTDWFDVDYDLYFKIEEGAGNKLVGTNEEGKIASKLIESSTSSITFSPLSNIYSATDSTAVIKMSPKGTRFCIMAGTVSSRQTRFYRINDGVVTYDKSVSFTGMDAIDLFFKNEEEIGIAGSDNGYDQQRLFVRNIDALSTSFNLGSGNTPDWVRSYTGISAFIIFVPSLNEWHFYTGSSTTWSVIDADDYSTKSTLSTSLPASYDYNGYDSFGNLCRLNTRYIQDGDSTWTSTSSVSISVAGGYFSEYAPLPQAEGEYINVFGLLVHDTTSTSSTASIFAMVQGVKVS